MTSRLRDDRQLEERIMKVLSIPIVARNRGGILITTLILLVMLTILSLTMMSLNITQTRIATNSADAQESYQTAEGALNQAAANLQAGNYSLADFSANANGLYIFSSNSAPIWTTVNWANAAGSIQCTSCGVSGTAAYVIEYLPPVLVPGSGTKKAYRITARAVGVSGLSPVILQANVLTP
jgi:type IV pilus assembly protein PilX